MKTIVLYRGELCRVDDEDFEKLSQYSWSVGGSGYAMAWVNGRMITMHQLLTKTSRGMPTDHIDRNKLNNQRNNLRVCTQSENVANGKMRANNMSGYRGVIWSRDKWFAQIKKNYKNRRIGPFNSPKQAAQAYDAKAKELHGEFASLNFP